MSNALQIPESVTTHSGASLLRWDPEGDQEPGSVMVASGMLGPRSWIAAGPQIASATRRTCLALVLGTLPIDPGADDLIAHAAAVISAEIQGLDPRVMVAHSFAGPLFLAMLANDAIRPPGVTGLVLCNSMLPVKMTQVPKFARSVKGGMPEVPVGTEQTPSERVEMFLDAFVVRPDAITAEQRSYLVDTPPNPAGDADTIRQLQQAIGAASTRIAFGKGLTDLLKACPVPVKFLMGAEDPLVPTFLADNLTGRGSIPGVEVEIIERCGQFCYIDAAADVAQTAAGLVGG